VRCSIPCFEKVAVKLGVVEFKDAGSRDVAKEDHRMKRIVSNKEMQTTDRRWLMAFISDE
jgi:hypothetical protein